MNADAIRFRYATVADIPGLVDLVTACYRGEHSRKGWTTEADILDGNRIDPDVLRDDIERPLSRILVAESAEATVPMLGCAHVCVDGDAGYFGMFSVRPERQRDGLGRRMLAEAERIVGSEFGMPLMRMTVIDCREELIRWYERRGYRRTGIKKPFPYGDERFGIPKRPDLQFEVLEKPLAVAAGVGSDG
jgi:ribosomal protein S18 acetylase RimI-like enzyme